MGLGGRVPPRVDAATKSGLLDLLEQATQAGWTFRAACRVLELGEVRTYRWLGRRAADELADQAPGGSPVHGLLEGEVAEVTRLFGEWGEVDRSHRKLAHRGSSLERVWVSPASVRRVLARQGLRLRPLPRPGRSVRKPFPDWVEYTPNSIWVFGTTPCTRAGVAAAVVEDLVSRTWLAEVVSAEETSTQVQVVFTEALEREGLLGLVTARQDGLVDPTVDDPSRPILLALSDNGPRMTSGSTRGFMALCATHQHSLLWGSPNLRETLDGVLAAQWLMGAIYWVQQVWCKLAMWMTDNAGGGLRGLRAAPTAELTEALLRRYGIDGRRWRDLGGSSNLNLIIADGAARYVVRVYRPYVTVGRLADIQLVRRELDRAGVPCPQLVPARDGEPWVRVGGRLVEVERFVDHDAEMNSWGRLQDGLPMLGRIHSLLQPIEVSAEGRRPLFANHVEPTQARSWTAQATARIRGWQPTSGEKRLARLSEELAELVTVGEASQAAAMPRQLVHGDFWDNNVGFRHDRVVLVTDFDFVGERARVDDLALTLYFADATLVGHADDGGVRIARLRRLADAYDSGLDTPLTAAERAALPWAMARQPLWAIGGWLAWLDDEKTARDLAAAMLADVERALQLVREIDRWQQAFV